MKRAFCAVMVFIMCAVLPQSVVFAEEIYQDENGVWRNRPTTGEVLSEGTKAIGETTHGTAQAGLLGLTKMMAAPIQESYKEFAEGLVSSSKETIRNHKEAQEEALRLAKEKNRVGDISEYERFDPATAGEIKSEWEFFDDPRDKKE